MLTRYVSLGFFFAGYLFISLVVNIVIILGEYLFKGFVFSCYLVHVFINKIFLNSLISTLVYAVNGITVSAYLIYKYIFVLGSRTIVKAIIYNLKGFLYISYKLYRFIKLVCFGFAFPFVFVYNIFGAILSFFRLSKQKQQDNIQRRKDIKIREEKRQEEDKKRKQELAQKRKLELINLRKRRNRKEEYINENVEFKKKNLKEYIEDYIKYIKDIPQNIKKFFIDKYNNLSLVKNAKNAKDINRQVLLINFEGADAEKSDTKILYEYVAKNTEGKLVKGYFEAFSKVEVHSFLLSEGFEVYSIKTNKWITLLHGRSSVNNTKIKLKDLIFFLTQLSTYIKSGIPLVDSLKILTRQYKNKTYKRIFRTIIYDLTMGDSFSDALTKQGTAFPRLLINMVKAAEMTGELPEALDDMADYYTETEKTRKQMITALMYPTIIFVISLAVITFIMVFVIPRFVEIYQSMDSDQIPAFTRFVISASSFLENNLMWLFIILFIVIIIIRYLYINVKIIRTFMQWGMMHMPVFGNVIIFNEVTMFTKTFASLLSHNVFITDSMEVLNKITNNEIYKMLILDTITNLAKGDKISLAFKNHWAFPIPAYEMLVTGEKTGQLAEMMGKVSTYYQELHKNAVTRIKTFVEPVLIIFLTAVVGVIILSIVIPMFNMYTTIQQ